MLVGCAKNSSISQLRVNEVTPNNIRISSTDITLATSASDETKHILAAEHCGKYGKYFFFYANDWNINGSNFVCDLAPKLDKKVMYSNYGTTITRNTSSPQTEKEKLDIMSSIKKTCKEFGFKEGTEKYAECLKDLYLKENTQQQSTQSIIVNDSGSQAIADEMKRQRNQQTTNELLNLSRELSKGKSLGEIYGGAPPKSGSTGGSCTLTNSVQSGTNRICYYKCGVSTQTSNVGAAQTCPLTM